jgi:hypothetical protein
MLFPIFVFVVSSVGSAHSGPAKDSCERWAELRQSKTDFIFPEKWLSSHGLGSLRTSVIFDWFDSYCRDNPSSNLDEAADKLREKTK